MSPSTEISGTLSFVDDFGSEIMAVMEETDDFELSAIERMLADEEHAFHLLRE